MPPGILASMPWSGGSRGGPPSPRPPLFLPGALARAVPRGASGAWCLGRATSSRMRSRQRSPRRSCSSRRRADSSPSPMRCVVVALALLVFPAAAGGGVGRQGGPVAELIRAQTELIARTREYRENLERVLGFQEAEAARAEA